MQCLHARPRAPLDAVLDRLGGVRLRKGVLVEGRQKGLQLVLAQRRDDLVPRWGPERRARPHEQDRLHAVRVVDGQPDRALGPHRQRQHDGPLRRGRVEDRSSIGGVLRDRVPLTHLRPVGPTVAHAVPRDHAVVPGEVGHLHLPGPRVDDAPRRHDEQRRLSHPAEHLVADARAVPLDEAGRGRFQSPHRFSPPSSA